jgi:hypothetical protein
VFLDAPRRARDRLRVRDIELVPRVARAIHYDLNTHLFAPMAACCDCRTLAVHLGSNAQHCAQLDLNYTACRRRRGSNVQEPHSFNARAGMNGTHMADRPDQKR